MISEPSISAAMHTFRRFVFLYLVFGAIGLQLCSAVSLLRSAIPIWPGFWAVLLLPVVAALAALRASRVLHLGAAPIWWTASGFLIFGLWAGGYFAIGKLVDPTRIRLLSGTIEPFIPLLPAVSLLYLCVHPLSVLPYFGVEDVRRWHRIVTGHLFILAVSFISWTAFPVTVARPELAPATGLAEWTLGVIYGADPAVNCLPSTHCAMALFAAFVLLEQRRGLGIWALITALAIGASTLLTKQHYFVDVVSGYMLASVAWVLARRLVPVDEEQPLVWAFWRDERL